MTAQPGPSTPTIRPDGADDPPETERRPAAYHSIRQLRVDLWWSIADAARRLSPPTLDVMLRDELTEALHRELADVATLENFYAFPGKRLVATLSELADSSPGEVSRTAKAIGRNLVGDTATPATRSLLATERDEHNTRAATAPRSKRPAFDVLVVADLSTSDGTLRHDLRGLRRPEDAFTYELVVVPSLADAVVAVLVNANIQAVIVRPDFRTRSAVDLSLVRHFSTQWTPKTSRSGRPWSAPTSSLNGCGACGPSWTSTWSATPRSRRSPASWTAASTASSCARTRWSCTCRSCAGWRDRYQTPFFTALKRLQPPAHRASSTRCPSRAASRWSTRHWITDMAEFYGLNIFLAETSATSGGLDSLLEPHRPDQAMRRSWPPGPSARRQTFFVTNGTSTANKIVIAVAGHARRHRAGGPQLPQVPPLRADAGRRAGRSTWTPTRSTEYSMYGAVPLASIKRQLLAYRRAGQARPGQDAGADQLHVRRHRLRRRAGDGGMPGHQARPGLPVGRGLVRLRRGSTPSTGGAPRWRRPRRLQRAVPRPGVPGAVRRAGARAAPTADDATWLRHAAAARSGRRCGCASTRPSRRTRR